MATSLEMLLSGRDPISGIRLGGELLDKLDKNGHRRRAVAGFDATFSAPKSLSVWWALTGDHRLLEAHDVAVRAALAHLERFGSTTRVRASGVLLHPDTGGLTMATFRQTTSRADDPQIHTHAVVSAKVRTAGGRWMAVDARYLKRHQRTIGGLYQSVLRAELTQRLGVGFGPIVNGQAEIAGMPAELLDVFSKRSAAIDVALDAKLDEFRQREGRDPSRWERAALTREASADTRAHKSGHGVPDLTTRWQREAADVGWIAEQLTETLAGAGRKRPSTWPVSAIEVLDDLSDSRSAWGRADVLQALCDRQRPAPTVPGVDWAAWLETATDKITAGLVDLDPDTPVSRRASDGRSVRIEPTAVHYTTQDILIQEEAVLSWAALAQLDDPAPSASVRRGGLDPMQAAAAASVAGHDRLTLVVGPAGAGKTRMLTAGVDDLERHGRPVFGVAPTAKAARVLEAETRMHTDTVAKLLHEWRRADRPPDPNYCLPQGTTLVVDEAGMLSTPALHDIVELAEANRWRLVLVGDPRQLQAVGRGGLFDELCATGRVDTLEHLHRFQHRWEAGASLQLRAGDPRAIDLYDLHDRIHAGTFRDHVEHIAYRWIDLTAEGGSVGIVASTNEQVDHLNRAVQYARRLEGQLDSSHASIAGGEIAFVGEVVMTRRNERRLVTDTGEPVRNRETWTVTGVHPDGSLTLDRRNGPGSVVVPVEYARAHVRLGYAATEHGWQADNVDVSLAVTSAATGRRGLYVAATRGREENHLHVVTETSDPADARDVLEQILAIDRADTPAIRTRRELAEHNRPAAPAPRPRCPIPDWFDEVLAEASVDLVNARQRSAERAHRRAVVDDCLVAARDQLSSVECDTDTARSALYDAERAARDAELDLHASERRLAAAPRLHRRGPRHERDQAAHRLAEAREHLAQTADQTASDITRYEQAVVERNAAVDAAHGLRTDAIFEQWSLDEPTARQRVEALVVWRVWADGKPVRTDQLVQTAEVLAELPDRSIAAFLCRQLEPSVPARAVEPVGHVEPSLGIELDF